MSPNMQIQRESGDAMQLIRTIATYLIIVFSVIGIGSYPPIM